MIRSLFFKAILLVFTFAFVSISDALAKEEIECGGFVYRAKRDGVPIYELPDVTSKVLGKINLGDLVCYIGERDKFAIVEWGKKEKAEETIKSAFIKKTDLWESKRLGKGKKKPKRIGTPGIFERVKNYFDAMRYGVAPDMPLIPYDPTGQ